MALTVTILVNLVLSSDNKSVMFKMLHAITYLSRFETYLPHIQCCSWQEQPSARSWNHLWLDNQHPRFPLHTQNSTLEFPSSGSIQVPFPEFSDCTISGVLLLSRSITTWKWFYQIKIDTIGFLLIFNRWNTISLWNTCKNCE